MRKINWIYKVSVLLALIVTLSTTAIAVEISHYAYSGHGKEWRQFLEQMAEKFEAETGIKVSVSASGSLAEYVPKITTMVAGGVAPDVTDLAPGKAGGLITQGMFEDLRPYIERDKVPMDQIPPGTVLGMTAPNGQIWGMPWDLYPMVTFFNADMFQEAGLMNPQQLGEEWNWANFENAAKRFTSDLNGDGTTDRYGLYRFNWRWEMHVYQAGGKTYDSFVAPTEAYFTSQIVRDTVKWLHQLMAIDKVDSLGGSYQVWNEKAAMTLAYGPGAIGTYLSKVPFEWGMAMQPMGAASRAARSNPDAVQILEASQNKEAAWEWVKFLTTNTENQLEMARLTSRLPAFRGAMLRYPEVVKGLPSNWMAFIETAFDPASYTPHIITTEGVQKAMDTTMGKIWKNQVVPETALEQLQEQVTALFEADLQSK